MVGDRRIVVVHLNDIEDLRTYDSIAEMFSSAVLPIIGKVLE